MNKTYTNLIAVLAVVIAVIALTPYFCRKDIIFELGGTEEFSRFGSYAGGILTPIFSFFSILILIKTLNETKKANLQQSSVFTIEILKEEIRDRKENIENLLDKKFNEPIFLNIFGLTKAHYLPNFFISFKEISEDRNIHFDITKNSEELKKMVERTFKIKGHNKARDIIKNIRTNLENYRTCVSEILGLEASPIIKARFIAEFMESMERIRTFQIITLYEIEEARTSFAEIREALAENRCTEKMYGDNSYFTQKTVKISRNNMK